VLHITGITPLLSASCEAAVWKAIEIARAAGVKVSFDPNIRYKLIDRAKVPAFYRPFLAVADILLIGLGEMQAILDDAEVRAEILEEQMLAFGPSLVVVKSGAGGAVARTQEERVVEPAFPVTRVVDPIGAGDGFNAGFLTGYLRDWDLRRSLRLGNLLGASATGVHGDFEGYPDRLLADALLDRGEQETR
jgi:2-dehydro-3-deoxygluconokinase